MCFGQVLSVEEEMGELNQLVNLKKSLDSYYLNLDTQK